MSLFCYLCSLPTTLQSPTCWDFFKILPIKLTNFSRFPLLHLNPDPNTRSFLTLGASIPHALRSATLLPHQIYLEGPIWVFWSSQAPHQNCSAFPHILAFVFAPITACQTLHHPSRSISSIIFPAKLPCPPQPEMNFPVFWLLRPTCHSSFILRLLKFLRNRAMSCT